MFVVLNTSDVVILGHTAGAAAIASYRSVLPVARLNQIVMNSFSLLFAPLMARLWARGDRQALARGVLADGRLGHGPHVPGLRAHARAGRAADDRAVRRALRRRRPVPADPVARLLLQRRPRLQRGHGEDDRAGVAVRRRPPARRWSSTWPPTSSSSRCTARSAPPGARRPRSSSTTCSSSGPCTRAPASSGSTGRYRPAVPDHRRRHASRCSCWTCPMRPLVVRVAVVALVVAGGPVGRAPHPAGRRPVPRAAAGSRSCGRLVPAGTAAP